MKMGTRYLGFYILLSYSQMYGCLECHPKCTCNPTTVKCTNTDLTNSILPLNTWIPKTVQYISITGNHFQELPKNMFGNCSHDTSKQYPHLKKLDLSGNRIHTIHGMTFHCIPNLDELNLADNNLVLYDHTRLFAQLTKLRVLNMTNTFHDRYNNSVHVTKLSWVLYDCVMENLEFFYLAENEFQTFNEEGAKALCTLKSLKHLDLSRNNLSDPTFYHCKDEGELRNLKYLDFSMNDIQSVPKVMTEIFDEIQRNSAPPHELTVNYRHNVFVCDCQLKDFISWMKTTNVTIHQMPKLSCHDGLHMRKKLQDLNPDELCETLPPKSSSKSGDGLHMRKKLQDLNPYELSQTLPPKSSSKSGDGFHMRKKLQDLNPNELSQTLPAKISSIVGVAVLTILLIALVIAATVLIHTKRDKVKPYWKRAINLLKNAVLNRKNQFGYSSVSAINTTDI